MSCATSRERCIGAALFERNNRFDDVREMRRVLEPTDFAAAEAELRARVDARARTTGEGPSPRTEILSSQDRERAD